MADLTANNDQRLSLYLTTEHFTLQGARSATISEANGRLGHYISIVGSSVVALAFVANVSSLGEAFFAFAVAVLPVIILLGIVTLIRTMQISIDYARLTQAINRIRNYYLEEAPEGKPYFSLPHFDDQDSVMKSMMPFHFPLQGLASTPGPIILINSVLFGAFSGILFTWLTEASLSTSILVSLVGLALAMASHMAYSRQLWQKAAAESLEARFPSTSQS